MLDLTTLPVVIDEPGLYAIDRDWSFDQGSAADPSTGLIRITADDVTLDLHGFKISSHINALPLSTLLVVSGVRAEVRNGGLEACCDGAEAVESAVPLSLHHLSLFSNESMTLPAGAVFTDSEISMRVTLEIGGRATLERNTIFCNRGPRCVKLMGDGGRVTGNSLSLSQGGGIEIVGDRNVVSNNVIDANDAPDAYEAFDIKGDSNAVRGNTLILAGNGDIRNPFWVISGTGNTLEGNIAAPPFAGEREQIGMEFRADGNYYGNNRIAATVPFSLGGTVQTDWGGNVGY